MLEEEAVERIKEFTACNEQTARETLQKLKANYPGIVRVVDAAGIPKPVNSSPVPTDPPQVHRYEIDRWYPAETARKGPLAQRQDRITLTHGVARLAYGDAARDRYNSDSNGTYLTEAEARWRRRINVLGPSTSGLPGTEELRLPEGKMLSEAVSQSEKDALHEAMAAWETRDAAKWREGEARLLTALAGGALHAIDENGKEVREGFWLQHHLTHAKTGRFLLRASDFEQWLRRTKVAETMNDASPPKRRGPPATMMNRAAAQMVKDVRSGKCTLADLQTMKQESLAAEYGLKSRDTARKALKAAAAEIAGISNSDK
jgi:hypothetical protein